MDENDELYPEKYAEDEVIVKITNLQRLKVFKNEKKNIFVLCCSFITTYT